MTTAFDGLRVLDLTQGMAGSLTTMIFADFGADVIRVEPAGGDPNWSRPAYLLWQRGKRSIDLDLHSDAGAEQARQLIASADVLVETHRPGYLAELGLGHDAALEINPALVYLSISAFGQEGPYRDLAPYDGIVNAKAGRMRDQVGWHPMRPVYRAVNDTSYHAAMFSVQAVLAALRVSWMTGRGQYLETSLLHGVTAPNNPWRLFAGEDLPVSRYPNEGDAAAVLRGELVADRKETDPYSANPFAICLETRDNRWIMHAHPQYDLFRAWIDAIGMGWVWDDPRFKGAPHNWNDDADRIAFNLTLVSLFKSRTAQEWIELYVENPDCAGEIMQTTQDALRHEQFIHSGHVVSLNDPRVGQVHMVGPLAQMSRTPARIARPAPLPGQHTAEVLASIEPRRQRVPTGGTPRRPLEGIVMLEFASWLAAPFAGALMADLGARVIKVEQLAGDPFRAMITNENGIRATQGKQSVSLDLKSPEGREILDKLIERADVLMHNYRPGVPERLGLDYDSVRRINGDIVYLYAGSYGSSGRHSRRAAFNPTMGAFAGNSVFQSGECNIPIGDQSPDPIAGSGVATGIMLGLAAAWNTGISQYLETTMMNSVVYCNSDDALYYEGKPARRQPDHAQLGLDATYRLYEAEDGWIFLAAQWDDEFAAFCRAAGVPELSADPRFATEPARHEHRAELAGLLEPVFGSRGADDWEIELCAAGVGCVRADGPTHKRFLYEDEHLKKIDFMVRTRHPLFAGDGHGAEYFRHSPQVAFSTTPCPEGLPYTALGEYTRPVLRELGYPDDEIDRLCEQGVVVEWKEPISSAT